MTYKLPDDLKNRLVNHTQEWMREQTVFTVDYAEYRASRVCQSPIESVFLVAWFLVMRTYEHGAPNGGPHKHYEAAGSEKLDESSIQKILACGDAYSVVMSGVKQGAVDIIVPQVRIDKYTADFVWIRCNRDSDPNDGFRESASAVVIECDGHDFHDRDAGQLRRDRRRDRDMLAGGHRAVRFTGSEIHKDALGCVVQAAEILDADLAAQYRTRTRINKQIGVHQ